MRLAWGRPKIITGSLTLEGYNSSSNYVKSNEFDIFCDDDDHEQAFLRCFAPDASHTKQQTKHEVSFALPTVFFSAGHTFPEEPIIFRKMFGFEIPVGR